MACCALSLRLQKLPLSKAGDVFRATTPELSSSGELTELLLIRTNRKNTDCV